MNNTKIKNHSQNKQNNLTSQKKSFTSNNTSSGGSDSLRGIKEKVLKENKIPFNWVFNIIGLFLVVIVMGIMKDYETFLWQKIYLIIILVLGIILNWSKIEK